MSSLITSATRSPQLTPLLPKPVLTRLQAGPTAADVQTACGLISSFANVGAAGSARFSLAALLGDRDAEVTVEYLREAAPYMGDRLGDRDEEPSSSAAVEALSFLEVLGQWLVQVMTPNDMLARYSQGIVVSDTTLRFMSGGSANYYGHTNKVLSFHYDVSWVSVLLNVYGAGTVFLNGAGQAEQLGVGELLLMSGLYRVGFPPTYHAAPLTSAMRTLATFSLSARHHDPEWGNF